MSLRDELLAEMDADLPTREVTFLGKQVRIRALNAGEMLRVYGRGGENMENLVIDEAMVSAIVAVVMDPTTNEPVFTDLDKRRLLSMKAERAVALSGLFREINDLTGTNEEVSEELLAEAKKNSNGTQSSESTVN